MGLWCVLHSDRCANEIGFGGAAVWSDTRCGVAHALVCTALVHSDALAGRGARHRPAIRIPAQVRSMTQKKGVRCGTWQKNSLNPHEA